MGRTGRARRLRGMDFVLHMGDTLKHGRGASQRPCGWWVEWGGLSSHADRKPNETTVVPKPEGEEEGAEGGWLGADLRNPWGGPAD